MSDEQGASINALTLLQREAEGDGEYAADAAAILAALKDAARLRAWFRANWADVCDGCDIDGGDWQDRAEAAGLLVTVPASDDVRADYDVDTMLVPWYAARAAEGETP